MNPGDIFARYEEAAQHVARPRLFRSLTDGEWQEAKQRYAPSDFYRLPVDARDALLLWVRLALKPFTGYGADSGRNHSAALKHEAERALGFYVSQGAMKGALLLKGYTPREDDLYETVWTFNVARRAKSKHGDSATLDAATPLELAHFYRTRVHAQRALSEGAAS